MTQTIDETETQLPENELERRVEPREPVGAIIPMTSRGLAPGNFEGLWKLACCVSKSGMAPRGLETPEKLTVAMAMGAELGITPLQAIQNIAVINGRPAIFGDLALALVTSREDCEDIEETVSAESATCMVKRKGRKAVERTFTSADARAAGLWGKQGTWTQYPKRMLQMRARGFALRDAFPDALKGVAIAEEAMDIPVSVTTVSEPEIKPTSRTASLATKIAGTATKEAATAPSSRSEAVASPRVENEPPSEGAAGDQVNPPKSQTSPAAGPEAGAPALTWPTFLIAMQEAAMDWEVAPSDLMAPINAKVLAIRKKNKEGEIKPETLAAWLDRAKSGDLWGKGK